MTRGSGTRNRLADQYPADKVPCAYCGREVKRKDITTEHRIPVWRGGRSDAANIVLACKNCNHAKGPLTEEEFLALRHDKGALKNRVREVLIQHNHFIEQDRIARGLDPKSGKPIDRIPVIPCTNTTTDFVVQREGVWNPGEPCLQP